jgi:hypothetical protein
MSRRRIVTESFSAKKYAKLPPESSRFGNGDRLTFLHHADGHTIFRRETDKMATDPYIASDATFDQCTKEPTRPSPR